MDIDLPDVHAELSAVFARYEHALVTNDTATLDALFWASPRTVRYGIADHQHGIDAIRAFRAAQPSAAQPRRLVRTVITTYGRDFATAVTEFVRPDFPVDGALHRIGRQSQTWCRIAGPGRDGWRVVSAHVSLIDLPSPATVEWSPSPAAPEPKEAS